MRWCLFWLAACSPPLVDIGAGQRTDAETTAASSGSSGTAEPEQATTLQTAGGTGGSADTEVDTAPRVVAFTDVSEQAGLVELQASVRIAPFCLLDNPNAPGGGDWCTPERMTGGIAVGDYDDDGRPDLFITRLDDPDQLLHNEGDGTFVDRAAEAGIVAATPGNGAAWIDADRDGDLDLMVTTVGGATDHLWMQIAPGRFEDQAIARGAAGLGEALHVGETPAVGDYDRDGWPDLFVGEWRPTAAGGEERYLRLLHNLGGVFEDTTLSAGLAGIFTLNDDRGRPGVFFFGPAFVDLDADGWLDLAMTGDFGTSRLLWNDRAGGFVDGTELAGVGTDRNGMGSTFGDIDNDGDLDWFVTAIATGQPNLGNRLYLYEGDRTFRDATDDYGVRDGSWAWGTAMADLDNDGMLDLVATAGWVTMAYSSVPMKLWLGEKHPRVDTAAQAGLDATDQGRGLAVLDYDADGDLDVVAAHFGSTPRLYRNDSTPRTFLRVRVRAGGVEPEGRGAVVTVQAAEGDAVQLRHIGASTHLLGQSERVAHFGLGDHEGPIARVQVRLPDGRTQVWHDVEPDREVVLQVE
jgi:hypothetical protein